MTNGDRIRRDASTNEGLAELIEKYVGCGCCPINDECGKKRGICNYTLRKWLERKHLEPCPFCGGKEADYHETVSGFWIECPSCGAQSKRCCTLKAAETLWNRRV